MLENPQGLIALTGVVVVEHQTGIDRLTQGVLDLGLTGAGYGEAVAALLGVTLRKLNQQVDEGFPQGFPLVKGPIRIEVLGEEVAAIELPRSLQCGNGFNLLPLFQQSCAFRQVQLELIRVQPTGVVGLEQIAPVNGFDQGFLVLQKAS